MKKFLMIFLTVCMVVSCMIVPSFAVNYPDVPEDDGIYFVVHWPAEATPVLYYYDTDDGSVLNIVYRLDSQFIEITSDSGKVSHKTYRINSDGEWYLASEVPPDSQGSLSWCEVNGGAVLLESNVSVYDENGDLFFQVPLPSLTETVEELTMEQGAEVQNQTVKMMNILLPCGVGCLALLMALPTLRKGFLRFLH